MNEGVGFEPEDFYLALKNVRDHNTSRKLY